MTVRAALALVLGALIAWVGALILGEYEFRGTLPFVVGPLFGLAIGEVVAAVGRSRALPVAAVTGAVCFGGVAWAGWIDSSEGVEPIHPLVWVAAVLGFAFGFVRIAGLRRRPASGA